MAGIENKDIYDPLVDDNYEASKTAKNNVKILNDVVVSDESYMPKDGVSTLKSSTLKRSFAERWFSKIENNSLRGNIFNLCILSLGTGCLSMPGRMANMSLIAGCVSIIVIGISSYWTLYLLLICAQKENCYDFTFLVNKIYGKKLGKLQDFFLFLYIFGQITLYQVISKYKFILIS